MVRAKRTDGKKGRGRKVEESHPLKFESKSGSVGLANDI